VAKIGAAGPLEGPNGARIELKHIEALGRVSAGEVAAQLAAAPIFATAALYEPFGLGVLEAAQAGCALVLSDIPTLRELWDGAALFVPADDPEGFARTFDRLLANEPERAVLARQARARGLRYSIEANTQGMLDVYARFVPRLRERRRQEAAA
jgi:glycogen synthase